MGTREREREHERRRAVKIMREREGQGQPAAVFPPRSLSGSGVTGKVAQQNTRTKTRPHPFTRAFF